jgi:hypothetical protein
VVTPKGKDKGNDSIDELQKSSSLSLSSSTPPLPEEPPLSDSLEKEFAKLSFEGDEYLSLQSRTATTVSDTTLVGKWSDCGDDLPVEKTIIPPAGMSRYAVGTLI